MSLGDEQVASGRRLVAWLLPCHPRPYSHSQLTQDGHYDHPSAVVLPYHLCHHAPIKAENTLDPEHAQYCSYQHTTARTLYETI